MTTTTTMTDKKITIATVKSFIRRNRSTLLVRVTSAFDGRQDGVRDHVASDFAPAMCRETYCHETGRYVPAAADSKDSLGIMGVWFTGRDSCRRIETDTVRGYEVYNCCGTWSVGVSKVLWFAVTK